MAAFEEAIPIPEGVAGGNLDGAFVEGVSAVSWMANNSKKLNGTAQDAPHCWTFFSTAAYGKKNKVPQVRFFSLFRGQSDMWIELLLLRPIINELAS